MMKTSIDGFLFDLDGTLVDSTQDLVVTSNFVRRHFGLEELSVEQVKNYVGDGVSTLVERLMAGHENLVEKALTMFKDHYFEHCTDFSQLFPGVEETLVYFHSKKKAVITNKLHYVSYEVLKRLEVDSHFEVIFGGDSNPLLKPHPMPLLKAIEMLHLRPEKTVMVGDGSNDIEAGKAAGVITCAVTYGMRPKALLNSLHPDFMIDRFEQLKELFD